jgi:sec-independent protein translocase protein TatC
MKTKRNKRVERNRTTLAAKVGHKSLPFSAHLLELRRRVMWTALSIGIGAALAYSVQQKIVAILLKPAGKQQFIYTSPGGGLNFLVQICIYTGIALSIPVIIYNILKFIEPVMPESSTRYILRGSAVAGFLAVAGIVFGYIFGLPSALKFLANQFTTDQIKALIAVQSYMHFVTMFLLASALIFQAPLIMLLINKIKPLKPSTMLRLKNQRWVILISFILGAVISPTPDIRSMMILSVPMIVSFEVGTAVVWHANRHGRKPKSVLALLEQDAAAQAERLRQLESAISLQFQKLEPALVPVSDAPDFIPQSEPVAEYPLQSEAQSEVIPIDASRRRPGGAPSGRRDYQAVMTGQRVRRRLVM